MLLLQPLTLGQPELLWEPVAEEEPVMALLWLALRVPLPVEQAELEELAHTEGERVRLPEAVGDRERLLQLVAVALEEPQEV